MEGANKKNKVYNCTYILFYNNVFFCVVCTKSKGYFTKNKSEKRYQNNKINKKEIK